MHDRLQVKEGSADAEPEERPRGGVRHLARREPRGDGKACQTRVEQRPTRGFQRPAGQEANHSRGSRQVHKVARNVA